MLYHRRRRIDVDPDPYAVHKSIATTTTTMSGSQEPPASSVILVGRKSGSNAVGGLYNGTAVSSQRITMPSLSLLGR
jgi:hypothetical protein